VAHSYSELKSLVAYWLYQSSEEDFKQWLQKRSLQTPPKGLLGKAISYTLRQWHRLVGYIEDGSLKPDNNAAENAIRPFVIGRNYADYFIMRSCLAA